MSVHVVTDSSCDLPTELVRSELITIVPLTIRFGEKVFVDREELSADDFWQQITQGAELPKTAAPSPGAFEEAFRKAHAAGSEAIICLCLSSKLSATYQSARLAGEAVQNEFPVIVIDTLSLTTALGGMVLKAAAMSKDGDSLNEIADHINSLIPQTHIFATLDTLEYLKKGGRIGGAQAFLGSLLSIKPVIAVENGEVEAQSKQRTRSRALQFLADQVLSAKNPQMISVCSGLADDTDQLIDAIRAGLPDAEILQSTIGPVIGTYGGPGVTGVTFVTPLQ